MFRILMVLILLFTGCGSKKVEDKLDYGRFYADGIRSEKWVALTFDDGPRPEALDKIFETLKKEDVKATFFVVGMNVKLHPEYMKKYIELGHEIGNHTYSHRNYYQLKEKMGLDEIEKILRQELDDNEVLIKNATGVRPLFMRMPNGFISPMVKKVAKDKNYIVVNWTFGCDWQQNTKDDLVKKYLRSVESGAIFLFHDKKLTAEALPEIIEGIKKKGYKIVPLRVILGISK
ncbi:MAG: polysaccharide deacetylase family protein [Elusimicrobia bacterium]|nr:polysaccharide deacetylase family protein [Elusimicrobiota bacterium]